jgi:hypothetical protein
VVNNVLAPNTVAAAAATEMVPAGGVTATFMDMLELELVTVFIVVSAVHDLKQPLE